MGDYSLSHLSDQILLRDLAALITRDRRITAALLAHLAEVDSRELYRQAGYGSTYLFCVEAFGLSEEMALKRIRAARAARRFPTIFEAVADGRLNVSAIVMLASHLGEDRPERDGLELLAAAERKTNTEIAQLLAERYPKPDVPASVRRITEAPEQLSVRTVEPSGTLLSEAPATPGGAEVRSSRSHVSPLSSERYAFQCTIDKSTREVLRSVQELLSHRIPSGDLAQVLGYSLRMTRRQLEKRKFAATSKPRQAGPRRSQNPRHIPAHVKRAVQERDRGQCTFVGDTGHRCSERKFLEYDHVVPIARGGDATLDNLRLRCRAHNQYEAERAFGTEFMNNKRERARQAAAERKAIAATPDAGEQTHAGAAAQLRGNEDVIPWLRQLGFTVAETRRAASHGESIADAPLERRVRMALSHLGPSARRTAPIGVANAL